MERAELSPQAGAQQSGISSDEGHSQKRPDGGMPTFLGGASIASGYTPPALAGALPRHPLPQGVPIKAQRSGFDGERRRREMSEPCRLRRGEGYAACADEGERSSMQKKKTEIITARMTPADKKAICQRAKAAGMTVTDYLTICALGKEIVRMDGLDGLLSELKAQGRNLNQLTTLANMGRLTVLRGNDLIGEYARLCDTVSTLIREVR